MQPFIVAAALPEDAWAWAASVYGIAVLGVATIVVVPPNLARPVGFAAATLGLLAIPALAAPAGMAWFGYVHIVKLVLAHAIPEHRQ